ncbi:MAG TPA: ATPase [Bacteroidota bacterium]|nr:ATPase [Bacteroidota bacterium]
MKNLISTLVLLVAFSMLSLAQGAKPTQATFTAHGNCSQCKARIEKALQIKEVKLAKWSRSDQAVTVVYNSSAITLDSLQHRVALVGHDTEKYKAADVAYNALPSCCLYRKSEK